MKLFRYGPRGREKPGVLDTDGTLLDASTLVDDWHGGTLDDATLARLREAVAARSLAPLDDGDGETRFGAPLTGVGKIIGIGLNYRAHAAEAGLDVPTAPVIFLKAASALNGPFDDIVLPPGSVETDWEVELAVVIGAGGAHIPRAQAPAHVAGYCAANDVSERDHQLKRGTQWSRGKSADTFAPLGPWLVTRDAVPEPQNLGLTLAVNGETMQAGNTADMIFPVDELIADVSTYMSLQPGDVLITGTPPGVGLGMKPPRYLRAGDTVHLEVEGLGEQRARVVDAPGRG
ncbi:MAG: fumarylacetoacetate hydrolase family protein [Gammaproteobacteria bacterium]|nr:fumarylacetoacetate hydrolase family protein [Gammaproteobacteria bacterium]